MSGLSGYDQWKTASPWDDEDNSCMRCGGKLEELDDDDPLIEEGFCSKECQNEYNDHPEYDGVGAPRNERLSDAQRAELEEMHNRARAAIDAWREKARTNPLTLETLFLNTPEGDFSWDAAEAGDWHVYNCGDSDCETRGWHKIAYSLSIGRKDGKRWAESQSVEDGGCDNDWRWEEGEEWEFGEDLAMQIHENFFGWFEYWVDCAQSGNDILGEDSTPTIERFIESARDALKYLEMGLIK